jgi:lipoprotein-anchoring transpeptidase ErfK/SrfK
MSHDDQTISPHGHDPRPAPQDGGHGGQGHDARLGGGLDTAANPPPSGAADLADRAVPTARPRRTGPLRNPEGILNPIQDSEYFSEDPEAIERVSAHIDEYFNQPLDIFPFWESEGKPDRFHVLFARQIEERFPVDSDLRADVYAYGRRVFDALRVHVLVKRLTISLAVAVTAGLLAGCTTTSTTPMAMLPGPVDALQAKAYAAPSNEPFKVDAVDVSTMDPKYLRQVVDFPTNEPVGTVVVDPHERFLYLVSEHGKALRYGVGVGKAGLEFTGTATIQYKKKWPHWTPTNDMIKREPGRYKQWKSGMDGGARNPLGARALYLFKGGKDTLFRIHGTTEPDSIGKAVSSGCIRMVNQDIIDLYSRIPKGSKVVVR